MICGNCGNQVRDDASFCGKCGCKLGGEKSYGQYGGQNKDVFVGGSNNSGNDGTAKYIVIGIVSCIVILGVVLSLIFMFNSTSENAGEVSVHLNPHESQTSESSFVLSGTAVTTVNDATISINGDVVESNFSPRVCPLAWEKEVLLNEGENTFLITITDTNGISKTEKVTVICEKSVIYKKGTVLVKYNKSGVYVRPTPRISDKFIMLIPSTDYTSQFVCLGEEERDDEGYVWGKVRTPSNGIGWIRLDLMRALN